MTVLSKPVPSDSHRSWDVIGGGSASMLVQRRTQAGIEKNKTLSHRIAYGSTDMFYFRIIHSTIAADFDAIGGAVAPLNEKQKHLRLIVAVSNSHDEIMRDWDAIKDGWRSTGGLVDVQHWEAFYQRVLHFQAEHTPIRSAEDGEDPDEDDLASDGTLGEFVAGVEGPGTESFGWQRPFAAPVVDANAAASADSGCSPAELWAVRLVSTWLWRDVYQSVLVMAIFVHGWYVGWMNWMTMGTVLAMAGLTLPKKAPHGEDVLTDSEIDGMTSREIEALNTQIQDMIRSSRLHRPSEARNFLATVALLHYISTLLSPTGEWTVIGVLEHFGGPCIALSLAASGLYHRFLAAPASHRPAPAPIQRPAPSGETAVEKRAKPAKVGGLIFDGKRMVNDDVLAPAVLDHIDKRSRILIDNFELFHKTDYATVSTAKTVSYLHRASELCDKKSCKFIIEFDKANAMSLDRVLNDDPKCLRHDSSAYKFDRLLTAASCEATVEEYSDVFRMRTCYKSPVFGVAGRDMVTDYVSGYYLTPSEQRAFKVGLGNAQNKYPAGFTPNVFVQAVIDAGNTMPKNPSYTRGAIHRFLSVAEDLPPLAEDGTATRVRVSMTLCMDPQGYIPAAIVDSANGEQVEKMLLLRELAQAIGPVRNGASGSLSRNGAAGSAHDGGIDGREALYLPPALRVADPAEDAPPPQPKPSSSSTSQPATPPRVLPTEIKTNCEFLKQTEWSLVSERSGVQYHGAPSPFCNKSACRFSMRVTGANAATLRAVLNDDPEMKSTSSNLYKYDALLLRRTVVPSVKGASDSSVVIVNEYKAPVAFVAPREMATSLISEYFLSPEEQALLGVGGVGGCVFAQAALDWGAQVPQMSAKCQRGAAHRFLFLAVDDPSTATDVTIGGTVRRVPTACDVVMMMSVDPLGSLPSAAVNLTNTMQIDKLVIVRDMLTRLGPLEPPATAPASPADPSPPQPPAAPTAATAAAAGAASSSAVVSGDGQAVTGESLASAMDVIRRYTGALLHLEGWRFLAGKAGAVLLDRDVPWCDKKAIRVHYFTTGIPPNALHAVLNDPARARQYDKLVRERRLVRQENALEAIMHTMYASPMLGIAGRDFVARILKGVVINDAAMLQELGLHKPLNGAPGTVGSVYVHIGSNQADAVPSGGGYQRGNLHHYGFIVQAVADYAFTQHERDSLKDGAPAEPATGVLFTSCYSIDPCGRLPARLVDISNYDQLDKMKLLDGLARI